MKKVKVIFLQTEWKPRKVLDTYKKMTPGCSGIWKNMEAVVQPKDADVAVIIDYTVAPLPADMPKVYIGAHPYGHHVGYRCYDEIKKDPSTIAAFDLQFTAGFLEWWLDETYDELMALQPPKKTKDLVSIISEKLGTDGHKQRRDFMERFCARHWENIEIYGRIQPLEHEPNIKKCYKGALGCDRVDVRFPELFQTGKTEVLKPARYVLEHDDNFGCIHYFSERFADDLLFWTLPIYFGGGDVSQYLPKNCYIPFNYDISPDKIMDIVNSDFREKNIEAMAEARWLILNKYQLWARVYNPIAKHFGLEE